MNNNMYVEQNINNNDNYQQIGPTGGTSIFALKNKQQTYNNPLNLNSGSEFGSGSGSGSGSGHGHGSTPSSGLNQNNGVVNNPNSSGFGSFPDNNIRQIVDNVNDAIYKENTPREYIKIKNIKKKNKKNRNDQIHRNNRDETEDSEECEDDKSINSKSIKQYKNKKRTEKNKDQDQDQDEDEDEYKKKEKEEENEEFYKNNNFHKKIYKIIKGPILLWVIYIILTQKYVNDFIGKYIPLVKPTEDGINIYGVCIYGIILVFSYFILNYITG